MLSNLANGSAIMEPFLALNQRTWGIIGVGGVLVIVLVSVIFYMLGSHSERH